MVEDGQGAADLLQVVLLQQRLDERLRPLRRRLGSVAQRSVRDEAETQRRRRQAHTRNCAIREAAETSCR